MGQGKGPVEYYVALIKPGAVLFELAGVPLTIAKEAFRLADAKLPFRCRFISGKPRPSESQGTFHDRKRNTRTLPRRRSKPSSATPVPSCSSSA